MATNNKAADFSLLSELQHDIELKMTQKHNSTPEIVIAAAPRPADTKKEQRVGRILANCKHPYHDTVRSMYARLQTCCSSALCSKSFGEISGNVDAAPGLHRHFSILENHMGRIEREPSTLRVVSTRESLARRQRKLRRIRRNAEKSCQQILNAYAPDSDLVQKRQRLVAELQDFFLAEGSALGNFVLTCTLTKADLHALRKCVKEGRPLYARRAECLLVAAETLFPPKRDVTDAYSQTWRSLNKVIQKAEAKSLQEAREADAEIDTHLRYGESEYLVAVLSAWSLLHSRRSGKMKV
jgi:hypothetical protein